MIIKRIFSCVLMICLLNNLIAQEAVWNEKLFFQANKNHLVRQASQKEFLKVFSETEEIYNKAKDKVTGIMAIHEMIYQQLENVHSLFRQGKKVQYIYEEIKSIEKNGRKALYLSKRFPQYSIWLKKEYQNIYSFVLKSQKEINEVILTSRKDILMDAYDRDLILEKIYGDLRLINLKLMTISYRIEYLKTVSYINSIPVLNNYFNEDKIIIKGLLDKYKRFKWK